MTDGGEGWAPVDNSDQDPTDDLGEPKEKMMKKELNNKLENETTNGEKAGFSGHQFEHVHTARTVI